MGTVGWQEVDKCARLRGQGRTVDMRLRHIQTKAEGWQAVHKQRGMRGRGIEGSVPGFCSRSPYKPYSVKGSSKFKRPRMMLLERESQD